MLTKQNDLVGKIALINMDEIQCFLPVSNAVKLVQESGAAAVLFIHNTDEIVTLAGGTEWEDELSIPSFVLTKTQGIRIANALYAGSVSIQLPSISPLTNLAPDTIEPEGGVEEEVVENDSEKAPRTKVVRTTKRSNSIIASAVLLCTIIFLFVGRQIYKKRKRARAVEMYDTLSTGTQFHNPMNIGMAEAEPGMGVHSPAAQVAVTAQVPVTQGDRVVVARPWVSGRAGTGGVGAMNDVNEKADYGGSVEGGGGGGSTCSTSGRRLTGRQQLPLPRPR